MQHPCTNCQGTKVVRITPISQPTPCPACAVMLDGEIVAAPIMKTMTELVIVKRPDGEAQRPAMGPSGSVSVGPGHLPGIGGVIHVALHCTDGTTVMATMGAAGLARFSGMVNMAARELQSGAYDRPAVIQ